MILVTVPGVMIVLFGDVLPTGKLLYSWSGSMVQIPFGVHVKAAGQALLFPFGFGLS